MRSVGIVVASLGAAAAFQPALCPTVRAARGNAPAISCSAVDRRSAVLGALSWGLLATPAFAYDAIPEVAADFEALEKKRAAQLAADKIKAKELNAKVAKIEAATTPQQFVAAADEIALWVIGNGKFPEGVKVKSVVERVKIAYDDQPIIVYPCKNNRSGQCERHDIAVEDAMQQLMNQMRKYSMIQVPLPPHLGSSSSSSGSSRRRRRRDGSSDSSSSGGSHHDDRGRTTPPPATHYEPIV